MKTAAIYSAPLKETPASLRDIITVKTSLAALLAEEADLMDAMQLAKVGALQERKLKLTGMLERYLRYLSRHPEVLATTPEDDKAEFRKVAAEFQRVMKRNYDTLMVARAVNKTVVKCITQVVTRREQNPVYNARGATRPNIRPVPISLTLNETA
jgi:hypothetical protein